MSTFEYMSVMHSIVLALGIARVLGGLADMVRHWPRLEAKWSFLCWLLLLLALHMGWWFGLWARFSAMADIHLTTFLAWFMVPASFYVACRLLIPDFDHDSLPDLQRRFDDVRIPFFLCFVVATLPVFPELLDGPQSQWLMAVFGASALLGVFTSSRNGQFALQGIMTVTYLSFLALARTALVG